MPHQLDVLDLLTRKIIISAKALEQLQQHIKDQDARSYRPRTQVVYQSVEERKKVLSLI